MAHLKNRASLVNGDGGRGRVVASVRRRDRHLDVRRDQRGGQDDRVVKRDSELADPIEVVTIEWRRNPDFEHLSEYLCSDGGRRADPDLGDPRHAAQVEDQVFRPAGAISKRRWPDCVRR